MNKTDRASVIADWCYIKGITNSQWGNYCIPYEELEERFNLHGSKEIAIRLILERLNNYPAIIECDFENEEICMWFYTDYLKEWCGEETDEEI